MTHPLVLQLRFTRSEFKRAMAGVTEAEAQRRFEPMNCISWIVGHLTWQEQAYWLTRAQNQILLPEINELAAFGKPASTPSLAQMWQAWETITQTADPWLDALTADQLTAFLPYDPRPTPESLGSMLLRMTYHYWYHLGESQAIRQLLGHTNVGNFVGAIHAEAPYTPE
ncbi:MAG TPA: DinB family protein [Phototrophicaceae bacterium]|nr:DinB family protein [Phototrophicaceae bacterium]